MDSDFITDEPKTREGMIELYKKISSYLGSKENFFNNSVPTSSILIPIQQVNSNNNQIKRSNYHIKFY